jgi:hypothetical protein
MGDDAFVRKVVDLPTRLLARNIVEEAHLLEPEVDATTFAVRFNDDQRFGWMEVSRPFQEMDYARLLRVA